MLLTWHNLHYYQALMAEARAAIEAGRLAELVRRAAAAPAAGGDAQPSGCGAPARPPGLTTPARSP